MAEGDRRPRLHPAELHALRRGRVVPGARHRAHRADLGQAPGAVRRGAPQGRARRVADSQLDHRPRARLHRPRERDHRRPADRGPAEARDHAQRRLPAGPEQRSRPTATSPIPRWSRPSRNTARRTTRRCSTPTPRNPALPQLAHPDRAARRLRPRPHHRRLPPRRAVRRRPADRPQAGGEARPRRGHVHRRDHPRPGGARRADPRARRAEADGRELRLRHLGPGRQARRKRCSGSTSPTWRR